MHNHTFTDNSQCCSKIGLQRTQQRAHVTPLFVSLHWLPIAARIKFKTLSLAYRTATGSAPSYFHSLMTIYIPPRSLRSVSERCLVVPSQRDIKSLSRTFLFTVPSWWNELPTPIWNAESLTIFKRDKSPSFYFEQCLKCCITSTSCDCLPLYNVSLIVFLNCKSLWIKASAKLINVKCKKDVQGWSMREIKCFKFFLKKVSEICNDSLYFMTYQ